MDFDLATDGRLAPTYIREQCRQADAHAGPVGPRNELQQLSPNLRNSPIPQPNSPILQPYF